MEVDLMSSSMPGNGSILRYPYLWRWQYEKGETEGRKARPVCLMLAIPRLNTTHLVFLAISSTPPRPNQTTIPIPTLERRRAGLNDWKEAWITVSEYNYDVAERLVYRKVVVKHIGRTLMAFLLFDHDI